MNSFPAPQNAALPVPHAPLGARASFDFGPPGAVSGFALPAGAAPKVAAFVGCRSAPGEPWGLLPTYPPDGHLPAPLSKGRFGRYFSLANDKWMIGPLVFKIATPFPTGTTSAEDDAFRYAPVVCAYLEYDNMHSDAPAELVFGLAGAASPLTSDAPDLCGFAVSETHGFATPNSSDVILRAGPASIGLIAPLASELHFRVPPHSRRTFPLVFGFFQPGFHYAAHHPNLLAVLRFGLAHHAHYLAEANARDADFIRSALATDEKQSIALKVRTWLSDTRRLHTAPAIDMAPLIELCRPLTNA